MPLYEYKCTLCQERFEVEQSFRDPALTALPGDEHEHQLKKVFSPVGISFRGGGFYRNEARSPSSRSDTSSSESSANGATTDTATTKPSEKKAADTTSSATTTTSD